MNLYLPTSENIYEQLALLHQLADECNKLPKMLVKIEVENSHYITYKLTNLSSGKSITGKYPYSTLGVKQARESLQYLINQ